MIQSDPVDVVIIGAGPAGCCAALRLLALGYDVAVIERRSFPRPQIGESISPGIGNILEYIGASSALETPHFLAGLPARVIWERREPESITAEHRGIGIMVDRAEFDTHLLNLVKAQGATIFQPAQIKHVMGEPYAWQIYLETASQEIQINARLILDASGRTGQDNQRFYLAPTMLAIWSHIDNGIMPQETCIEALPQGWLWGSPLPNGHYRTMAFVDPTIVKQHNSDLEKLLCEMLSNSELFSAAANLPFVSQLYSCTATPYLDREPWQSGYIKLGEAAFALDPLSSSGVEKAMRFSLQAVIAANTLLQNYTMAELAKDFYESQLLESVVRHTVWTRNYYKSAWPGTNYEFWHNRSDFKLDTSLDNSHLIARLYEACNLSELQETNNKQQPKAEDNFENIDITADMLNHLLQSPAILSPQICFIEIPCVVSNRVQLCFAVTHPNLARPVAFLAGFELVPLLRIAPMAHNLEQLISLWSSQMPSTIAVRIAFWLVQQKLLETVLLQRY